MKKIVTVIINGLGYSEEINGNLVKSAKMNIFDNLWNTYPHALLKASGEELGLLKDQVGNCKVGLMTIGAGRRIKKRKELVNDFLNKADHVNDKYYDKLIDQVDKDVHVVGFCSDNKLGNFNDILKMYKILVSNKFKNIHLHLIIGENDEKLEESIKNINILKQELKNNKIGDIASIVGQNYVINCKDTNVDYYDLIVNSRGINALNIERTVKDVYAKANNRSEEIKPIVTSKSSLKKGDILIWMSYYPEQAKSVLNKLINWEDTGYSDMKGLEVYTLFNTNTGMKTFNLVEKKALKNCLGTYLSELDFTQSRICESIISDFFNLHFDGCFDGKVSKCDKAVVESIPEGKYITNPELSCVNIIKSTIQAMINDYDFIVVNLINPELVASTGNLEATTRACMAVDLCLNKIIEKAADNFYNVVIVSDHGNVEHMIDEDGKINVENTSNLVPFIICDSKIQLKEEGTLVNVAPTILDYMDIAIPKEMEDSESLIIKE